MKRALLSFFAVLMFVIPAWQWTLNVISPWELFEHELPPGQWFYLISKLVAQYAFLFLTIQIIFGFLLAYKANQVKWLTVKVHRTVGICVLFSTMMHACLFIVAAWIRAGHFPLAVLGLHFDEGYYNLYISVGFLSACLLIVVVLIGLSRNFLPNRIFRYGHRLAWLVWILGFCHSVAIGTETSGKLVWSWFYLIAAALIGLLLIYRIYLMVQPRLITSN